MAPAALSAFVAGLGVLPYVEFSRHEGRLEAFKSAFDEDTYLLGDTSTPYRFLSDAAVGVIDLLTPGLTGLMIATDIAFPVLVVIAAWLLMTRVVQDTGVRILSVLLLLFGQEFFSLANSIVWPGRELADLRGLDPPTTLRLIPDATTSYFNLFRTPEPAVSWALLFGFLALVSDRDPLAAFERRRRRYLTYPIFAVLGFAYPFSSIPIMLITAVLCAWAIVFDRSRLRAVGVALLVGVASFLLALLISAIGDPVSGTSVVFSSRAPILTPAIAMGVLVVFSFLLIHRGEVFRRLEFLIPFSAALLPVAIANQQLVTGIMVSARDWERYTNYPLVIFALACLVASVKRRQCAAWRKLPDPFLRVGAWIAIVYVGVQLFGWQRDVFSTWATVNAEAQAIADALDGLSGRSSEYPVALESTGLVPLVRLLTDDDHDFVLDYTRLFTEPVAGFAEEAAGARVSPHRAELFASAYHLGWTPARLEEQLRSELEGDVGGFYAHFVFALADVWPPVTDSRRLRTDEALERLPSITAAYSEYLGRRTEEEPGAVLVVTNRTLADLDGGRSNELIGTALPSIGTPSLLNVYVQTSAR